MLLVLSPGAVPGQDSGPQQWIIIQLGTAPLQGLVPMRSASSRCR